MKLIQNTAGWLERHVKAIQGFAALATILMAVLALVGVKWQIDASAQLQREQSARDIYREFLNLSISKPDLAAPDYCALKTETKIGEYENYVEYLLYTSDQLLAVSQEWERTLQDHMIAHRNYLCGQQDWSDDTPTIQAMMKRYQAKQCSGFKPAC